MFLSWAGQGPQASSRCSQTSLTVGKDGTGLAKNLDRHPNYILAAYMASGT
ncbi:MAG: hypothetical protein QOD50_2289 [Actinomycetota bacterium]|nr:hypothetical protein [Actinomycetota bacterium]